MPGSEQRSYYVPQEKLTRYLLAVEHPVGGPKARLLAGFGFTHARARDLEAALLKIGRSGHLVERSQTVHGEKLVLDGRVTTPDGRRLHLRTIWIAEVADSAFRLVTAYPR